jgi:hypothetical protein
MAMPQKEPLPNQATSARAVRPAQGVNGAWKPSPRGSPGGYNAAQGRRPTNHPYDTFYLRLRSVSLVGR